MKLKKIASLALAGVMAVSMLAGCKGGSTVVDGNGNANVPSVVSAVNNGQSVGNKVKVTFTTDAALESAAKKAVALYQDSASGNYWAEDDNDNMVHHSTNLHIAIQQYDSDLLGATSVIGGLYNENNAYDGATKTFLDVVQIATSPASDAYIMNAAAAIVDNYVAQLDDTTKVTKEDVEKGEATKATEAGDDYFDYSYTGNVCLFSVETSVGVTNYFLATVIEQTVTEKTLEK